MAEPWEDPRSYAPARKSNRFVVRAAVLTVVAGVAALVWYGGTHPYFLGPDRDSSGAIASGGTMLATELHVGDCIKAFRDEEAVSDLPAISCTRPHRAEVFAIVLLARTEYPGDDELSALAEAKCGRAFDELEDVPAEVFADPTVGLSWLLPFEADWVAGDHRITCLVETDTARTGPIRRPTTT